MGGWSRWRHTWRHSLRMRLWVLGLTPLLFAFPVLLALLALSTRWLSNAELAATLRGSLSGSDTYLEQMSQYARQRFGDYVKSERLQELTAQPSRRAELEQLLAATAKGWGLQYLVVTRPDGEVMASSTGRGRGQRLPDSYVMRQARTGMSGAALESVDRRRLAFLEAQYPGHQQTQRIAPAHQDAEEAPPDLMISVAAHFPLRRLSPDLMLVGGMVLTKDIALVEHIREVMFPVGPPSSHSSGVISLQSGDRVIARSRNPDEIKARIGERLPAEIARAVLEEGRAWTGPLARDGVSYLASFTPLADGDGRRIGMLGVAVPSRPSQVRWIMLTVVATFILAAAMLAISFVFLRAGDDLVGRLGRLNRTMRQVREGLPVEHDTAPVPPDELGQLRQAFYELLDTLEQRNAALRTRHDELLKLSTELDEERSRLDRVVSGTHAGTWAWNVQTGETRFNERWAEMLGYRLDELQPTTIDTWAQRVYPEDLERAQTELQRHFRGEVPYYDIELRMRHRDGHWVWIQDRGSVSDWTPDGQPLWLFGTHVDISQRREAERARSELLDRLEHLSLNFPGVIYQYHRRPDGSSHFTYASAGVLDVYGVTPEDVVRNPAVIMSGVHPEDRDEVLRSVEASAQTRTAWHQLYRVRHPAKGERWVESHATPALEPDGSLTWHGYTRDVTDQQQDRQRLKLLASAYDASQEGVFITDRSQHIVDVNEAFTRITGYGREESIGHPPALLRSDHHPPEFYAQLHETLAREGRWKGEVRNKHKRGDLYTALMSVSAVFDDAGAISHYVSIISDITPLKDRQYKLDHLAHYDALTGIPNRRLLEDRLTQSIAQARRTQALLAVCMLDLDGFKQVNDRLGHAAGDRLLMEIAQRLTHTVRADETVARLGGDEFVLVLHNPASMAVFDRVLHAIEQPLTLDGVEVQVSASLGIAYLDHAIQNDDQLLREADQALYQSKLAGRRRYTVFKPGPSRPSTVA